jgi:hypothetical protein
LDESLSNGLKVSNRGYVEGGRPLRRRKMRWENMDLFPESAERNGLFRGLLSGDKLLLNGGGDKKIIFEGM